MIACKVYLQSIYLDAHTVLPSYDGAVHGYRGLISRIPQSHMCGNSNIVNSFLSNAKEIPAAPTTKGHRLVATGV
jgi:hypothetical protein